MRNRPRASESSRSAILVGLALLLTIGSGCGQEADVAPAEPRAVRYAVVGGMEQTRTRTFSGTAKSSQQSRLSFKVSGTVMELPIEVGDRLRPGQLVARIDPFQYELEVERAEADLLQARAAARNADATYERTKELYADSNASRGDLDVARANAESAVAQTRSAEKMVELSKLQVRYTALRAAVDCTVASIDVEVNENVGNGTQVATVNCGDALEVAALIPESLIGELHEGMVATVGFDAVPDATFRGVLTEIGSAAQNGAAFPVTVSIDGRHDNLRAGLAAEVRFDFERSDQATVVIPLSAVVRGQDSAFVYLAEPSGNSDLGQVARRDVELGDLTADGIEVMSGLAPGDRVITAGVSVIFDGLEVRLDPMTTIATEQG